MVPQFDPIWSWPWVIIASAASLAVVFTTYRQRIAHLSAGQRKVLLALRVFTWAILTLAMLRPALETTEIDRHASVFVVAVDNSRSMSVKDGPAGATRREEACKIIEDSRKPLQGLGEDIEVKRIDFGKEIAEVDEFLPDTPGEQTAIGHVLESIAKLAPGKKLVGVIFISDGAQRALAPFDLDPRSAANRLAEQQIRVDTVGIGTSGVSDTAVDLSIEDLEVNPTVFVKNTVVVRAKIRALGAENQDLTVRLWIEDPSTAAPGKSGDMVLVGRPRKFKATRNQEIIPIELPDFIARDPGEFKLMVEVLPLDGEAQVANNSMTTFISVLKGGVNVVYFDREDRAEQKFLRRIDESPDIQLDFKPIRQAQDGRPSPLDPALFKPGQYDVYIIGSVRASYFGKEALKTLAENVERGAGLLMTGGIHSFGPGGYAVTPLADELPVVTLPTEFQNREGADPTLHYLQELQMLPTPQGLSHFVMRLDSPDKNRKLWEDLPPLNGANKFSALKAGAVVLAEAPGKIPLLIAEDFGRGRTMAFAADSTWRWYIEGKSEAHQRFWQQVVLWLAHKDAQGDESVWVKLDNRRFRVEQPVGITFGARNADKRPIDDAVFKVVVTDPDGKKHDLTPQRRGLDHLARFLETRRPGDYRVHVDAYQKDVPIGLGSDVRFIVYDHDLELHNPAADFALLEEIAKITGGTNVPPGELAAHLRNLARVGLNVEVTRVTRILLWDNWPLLAVFVLAMSVEWFLRKRRGLV